MSNEDTKSTIRCHYEVLGVELNADEATIKKAHRRKALQYHPDKNIDDPTTAAENFRLVQEAYECLSDAAERKWYDEHREAILQGWSASGDDNDVDILFDVVRYQYAGCYKGYGDEDGGFFHVYRNVFSKILENESMGRNANDNGDSHLTGQFGTSETAWEEVAAFYQGWESFTSSLTYAWADVYDVKEAPNRRVRRAMEDENKEARRAAKRKRTEEILSFVQFVKRRDPRVKAARMKAQEEKARKEQEQKEMALRKKEESRRAREEWKQQAEEELAAMEEVDRLAGRVRLADLDDDYDYGGKKGKRKNKTKKNTYVSEPPPEEEVHDDVDEVSESEQLEVGEPRSDHETDNISKDDPGSIGSEEEDFESSEEEEVPDVWRCECCRKDFKSEGQMENHLKSKKHKQAYKKYQAKLADELILSDMMDENGS